MSAPTQELADAGTPTDNPPPANPRRTLLEVGLLFLVTCALIRGFLVLRDAIPLGNNWQIIVPILFIYAPVVVGRLTRHPVDPDIVLPEPLGRQLLRAARTAALAILAIYPLFIIGNHLYLSWFLPEFSQWMGFEHPFRAHHPEHGLPDDLLQIILWQIIAVGYAEEFFYRGYMQTRLRQVFGKARWSLWGAELGAPFWITAFLFTLGHSLVQFQWWQPAIFFPALVFGWLRARTGNILAPALFHAFANVAMITLDSIYGVGAA